MCPREQQWVQNNSECAYPGGIERILVEPTHSHSVCCFATRIWCNHVTQVGESISPGSSCCTWYMHTGVKIRDCTPSTVSHWAFQLRNRERFTILPSLIYPNCLHGISCSAILKSRVVSANRILWVYAGFWWYHGILVVHLQDSVGAFWAREGYSLYEGYYICSAISTPLFQVSRKFVLFRPLYFSKNWENVVFRPLFLIKIRQNV